MATVPLFTTGNEPPTGEYICRRFFVPKDFHFITAFDGALALLASEENWTQGGNMLPETAAEIARKMLVDGYEQSTCMIGVIVPVATAELPANMLLCDGSTHNREDYPMLYEALDAALKVDADHFQTPDLSDKFIMGSGAAAALSEGGEAAVSLKTAEMPYHNHNMYLHKHDIAPHGHTSPDHNHALLIPNTPMQIKPGAGSDPWGWVAPGGNVNMGTAQVTINETALETSNEQTFTYPTGNNTPHENRPPYVALKYGIIAR